MASIFFSRTKVKIKYLSIEYNKNEIIFKIICIID